MDLIGCGESGGATLSFLGLEYLSGDLEDLSGLLCLSGVLEVLYGIGDSGGGTLIFLGLPAVCKQGSGDIESLFSLEEAGAGDGERLVDFLDLSVDLGLLLDECELFGDFDDPEKRLTPRSADGERLRLGDLEPLDLLGDLDLCLDE